MKFEEDLNNSIKVLKEGGIILYPTDTIWGLGCDAANNLAVSRVFKVKNRIESRSLIILVNKLAMIERYVKEVPEVVYELLEVSDKPVTIIYPQGKNLATGVYGEDGSVAIRLCSDEFCNELITRFRKPVISTSANISGRPSPAHFGEIEEDVLNSADYVVKYRQNDRRKYSPSPVIKIDKNGVFKILRM